MLQAYGAQSLMQPTDQPSDPISEDDKAEEKK